jgi:sodium-dependent phosphate cotransporter
VSRPPAPHAPGGAWRDRLTRGAVAVVSLTLFVLALELMKAGARGTEALFSSLVAADDLLSALGVGWLLAFLVLSGSPVAAAAMALLEGGVLTQLQAFAMVTGSRFGASMVVVLIGFLWILRGRGTRRGLATGLLATVVSATTLVPALLLGVVVLQTDLVADLQFRLPQVGTLDRMLAPVVDAASAVLPGTGLFVLGTILIVASFALFDRALPDVRLPGTELSRRAVFRPSVMFLTGLGVTALTMSVSVSIGLLVPLSAKGLVRRENIVPYVMGCNVSTFIDTLVVALLVQTAEGFTVVLVAMATVAAVSLVIIAAGFERYQRLVDRVVDRALRTTRSLAISLATLVVVPLLLVVC